MKFWLVLLTAIVVGRGAAHANVCTLMFDDANPEQVQRELQQLPPLKVDYANYKRSMQSLLGNVAELREDWEKLIGIERDFIAEKITREQAVDAAKSIRESIASRAQNLLKKSRVSQRERETLEAYKLFLNQTSKLNQVSKEDLRRKYEPRKEEPPPKNRKTNSAKPGDASSEAGKALEKPLADDNLSERPLEERASGESDEKLVQSDDALKRNSAAAEARADRRAKSDPADKMKKSQFDQKFKPKPFADKAAAKPKPGEGKPGEGKPGEGKPGEGKPGEGKPGEGKPGEGKPGEGKPGEGKPGEGKPGEGKPGEGKPGEGKPGEGKPGAQGGEGNKDSEKAERRTANGERKSDDEGTGEAAGPQSDGENEGSSGLGQKISEEMSKFFKDLLDEAKSKFDAPKSDADKPRDLEAAQTERDEISKRVREAQRQRESKPGSTQSNEFDRGRPASEKFEFDPRKRDTEREKQPKLRDVTQAEQAVILKALLSASLTNVLKNYGHQDKMMTALGQLKTMAQTLYSENRSFDFLKQFALEVEAIREKLDLAQVSYKKLEDLGLSMIGGFEAGATHITRKLQYLDTLYTELGKRRGKVESENVAHDLVKRLLNSLSAGEKPSDRQLGEAFMAQLTGPLSKRVIVQTYGSEAHAGGINWQTLAVDIRSNKLDDLLIYPKLKPYMTMLLNQSMTPKDSKRPDGEREPINENAPELELAQELDRFQFFHRDGAPTETELMRFISGDMLENIFLADRIHRNPKTLRPRKVSIILYDISGSMGVQNKFVVRNALIGAYIDQTQIEVAAGREEHIVLTVAFDGAPHAPERMNTIQQAQAYFEKLRAHPIGSGGNDSITAAVANVFDLIAQQESTGALDRATVLLLTDAIATVDFGVIENARKKVGQHVDLRLNAVTMGDHNKDVQKLIEMQGGEGKGKLGVVSHQHISYEEVAAILNSRVRLELLEQSATLFQPSAEGSFSKDHAIKLKNHLVAIEERATMDDQAALAQHSSLIRSLQSRNGSGDDANFNALLRSYFRVVNAASGGWNRSTKLASFMKFMEETASELKVESGELIRKMSPEDSEKLSGWLGI